VPVHAVIAFAADGMTAGRGRQRRSSTSRGFGRSFGIVNYILGGTGLERRKYPMRTYVACGLREEVAIRLEAGFAAALSLSGRRPGRRGVRELPGRSFDFQAGVLSGRRALDLKVVEFSPAAVSAA